MPSQLTKQTIPYLALKHLHQNVEVTLYCWLLIIKCQVLDTGGRFPLNGQFDEIDGIK